MLFINQIDYLLLYSDWQYFLSYSLSIVLKDQQQYF